MVAFFSGGESRGCYGSLRDLESFSWSNMMFTLLVSSSSFKGVTLTPGVIFVSFCNILLYVFLVMCSGDVSPECTI